MGMRNKIRKQMKFYIEDDNELAKIYKYCKKFCFEWDDLERYTTKQIKRNKKDNNDYYKFLISIQDVIKDKDKYNKLKEDIETKFWEYKSKMTCPIMRTPTIWCNSLHTIKLEQENYYNWYFVLDSNIQIGGSERRGVFKEIIIPIKYSDYHYKILKDIKLNNTFKIRLNQNGNIEIMATYDIDKQYPELNEIKDIVGIDIGLKKLVVSSDGEIIDQNLDVIKYAKYLSKRKGNLNRYIEHLKKIKGDDYKDVSQRNITKQYSKLIHMVNCDNRYKIKQFLKGRDNDLIVMEDLNIQHPHLGRQTNLFLRLLHIQQIKEDVLRYCKEFGINIKLVNPSYTSQQCPICGYVDKNNRKTQEKFSCLNCGHTDNADHNASINIRDRIYIEDIKLDTPNWRIKELIALHYTTNN